MPFDHNDHYHRLLLRHLPRDARTALDVGCGTGRFARRLAERGLTVDAIDPSAAVIAEARARTAPSPDAPHFHHADLAESAPPDGHYDFIVCLASLHHMPFETVTTLRTALAPGGVLVVLGCYPERTAADWAYGLVAAPTNAAARLAVAAKERLRNTPATDHPTKPPVSQPTMPLPDIRREAARLLPGSRIRRLLFWRYLLVFHNAPTPPARSFPRQPPRPLP
ncbi:class I SAM-dependent methyltransferase [Embleya sp. AB8]|uniref:class I SAM-dependent methyltransferase n=1 Tax=Embleya sp. AB8 TaxID=3156304 RepID=UPI003C72DAEE